MMSVSKPSTPARNREPIAVIGAGIAGLSAAFRLQQAGYAVQVFEAEASVGGRMSTLTRGDYRIDLGVSVLPRSYRRMLTLIDDAGLGDQIVDTPDLVGVLRQSQVHRSRSSSKFDALKSGLLSARSKLILLRALIDAQRHSAQLSWDDLSLAAALDGESAAAYARRRMNAECLEYVVGPACRALFLSDPEQMSAVDFLFTIRNILGDRFFNSSTGVDFLPRGLAAQLPVNLGTRVHALRSRADGVELCISRGHQAQSLEHFAGCIIAVPAPAALALVNDADPLQKQILRGVNYIATIGVHFGLSRKPANEDAVLIQIPQSSHADFSLVIIDHNKAPGRAPAGKGLVSTFWLEAWSQRYWDQDDATIARAAEAAVRSVLPQLVQDIEFVHVQRWQQGIVASRTGMYRELQGFTRSALHNPRIQLACDFFSSTSSNSSLCAGENAARQLRAAFGDSAGLRPDRLSAGV